MDDRADTMIQGSGDTPPEAAPSCGLQPAGNEVSAESDTAEGRLSSSNLRALIEAILYVSPEPVTLDAILNVIPGEERDRVKATLEQLVRDFETTQHGIQIRPIAGGYRFSSKPEHHEVLRRFVKSLKPPVRLSKPALETLAVVAYRQPVTLPEIDEIRGVDCAGVIHTLLERKLVVTAGRKNVVGRPILYRTSRDFLVHFGLKDLGELPSLREFEELARQALGPELSRDNQGSMVPQDLALNESPRLVGSPDEFQGNADLEKPAPQPETIPEDQTNSSQPDSHTPDG